MLSRSLSRLLLSAAVLLSVASARAVEIVAHRGASHDAPENTLAAMKLAWEQNADSIELDLWVSKDRRIVVMHDGDTKRTTGVPGKIANLTLEEIRKLDAGAWKHEKFTGEPVPTLESILETIPAGKRAVLELKTGPEIAEPLAKVIAASGLEPAKFAVISFNFETLKASKALLPQIPHYFLSGYKEDKEGKFPELEPLLARVKAAGFEGLDLQYNWPIDRAFVEKVKAAGLQLIVWTVNDAAVAKRLADAGVDGITTDRPAWLREKLEAGEKTAASNP